MALKTKHYFPIVLLLLSSFCRAQTVFVTSEKEVKKDSTDVPEFSRDRPVYVQSAFSFPLGVNPAYQASDAFDGEDDLSFLIPDGLSAHVGAGVHFRRWFGVGMNVGLDWKIKQALVSAPVYASLFLNPHFNETSSIFMQAGYGRAFALGRGELNGIYQKYRIGFLADGMLFFADANLYGYGLHDIREMGSLSVGISLIDFFEKE